MLQDHEVIEPFNDKYSKLNKLERNRLNLLYKLIETYEMLIKLKISNE